MKILHISDTHGKHDELSSMPDADIIIHSGDFSEYGTEEEIFAFIEWFESLAYKYKIFIPGNHDTCLIGNDIEGLAENTFFLENRAVDIDGLKIYGSCLGNFNNIPDNTDILVTHMPPLGILDGKHNMYGDRQLLEKVFRIKPKLHLFGHTHETPGKECLEGITFSNVSGNRYHLFHV